MQTNVAVVGCGRWGQVLARAAVRTPGLRLVAAVDAVPGRARRLADEIGTSRADRSLASVLESDSVDAVLLATPASTHSSLAETVLQVGKHALVEKPLAFTAVECRRLGDLAASVERTPAPFGPRNPVTVPGRHWNDTSSTAERFPYRLLS